MALLFLLLTIKIFIKHRIVTSRYPTSASVSFYFCHLAHLYKRASTTQCLLTHIHRRSMPLMAQPKSKFSCILYAKRSRRIPHVIWWPAVTYYFLSTITHYFRVDRDSPLPLQPRVRPTQFKRPSQTNASLYTSTTPLSRTHSRSLPILYEVELNVRKHNSTSSTWKWISPQQREIEKQNPPKIGIRNTKWRRSVAKVCVDLLKTTRETLRLHGRSDELRIKSSYFLV